MRVQQVLMPDGSESWTVLGDDGVPVPAVEGFLAHLHALDRLPLSARAVEAIRTQQAHLTQTRPATPAWLFPSASDPGMPVAYYALQRRRHHQPTVTPVEDMSTTPDPIPHWGIRGSDQENGLKDATLDRAISRMSVRVI